MVPTTQVFVENKRKLSFNNYHQIPSLSGLLNSSTFTPPAFLAPVSEMILKGHTPQVKESSFLLQ